MRRGSTLRTPSRFASRARGLVRASNTTPVLVVRYEAKTKQRLEEIQKLVDGVIEQAKREVGS
jgi:phosphomannomutase / phosphoglucomutase